MRKESVPTMKFEMQWSAKNRKRQRETFRIQAEYKSGSALVPNVANSNIGPRFSSMGQAR